MLTDAADNVTANASATATRSAAASLNLTQVGLKYVYIMI
jgi:hypothetical protein